MSSCASWPLSNCYTVLQVTSEYVDMAVNGKNIVIPKTFSIRPGTIDYGKDYEVKMAALFILRCALHKNVRDVWLVMNADECGAFDDIVLYVETQDSRHITYLIQLKHKVDPSDIGAREFRVPKDFHLAKYYKTMVTIKHAVDKEGPLDSEILEHLQSNREGTVYILFTNRGTTENDCLKSLSKKSALDAKWLLYTLIDTGGSIFTFDYDKIGLKHEQTMSSALEKFFLYAKQIHIRKVLAAITGAVENLIKPLKLPKVALDKVVEKFVTFVNDWSKGELGGFYPLFRQHALLVLAEHMIAPYTRNVLELEDSMDTDSEVWSKLTGDKTVIAIEEDAIVTEFLNKHFGSVIRAYCEDSENKNLWRKHPELVSKKILRATGAAKEVRFSEAYECLWKNGELPLLLEANSTQDFENISHILGIFEEPFRVIAVTKHVHTLTQKGISKYFSTLKDLKQQDQLEILKLSVKLQGREGIQLLDFVTDEMMCAITVRDIIHILSGDFTIGDSFSPLPDIFVERSLEKVWFYPKVLREVKDEMFIVKCKRFRCFHTLATKYELKFGDGQIWQWRNADNLDSLVHHRIIVVEKGKALEEASAYVSSKSKTWHCFILHNEESLEWIKSVGTNKNIVAYRKNSGFTDLERQMVNDLAIDFSNKANARAILISAGPGMGKSVLMDYVALRAPTDVWVLKIDLFQHADYYKSEDFENSLSRPSGHLEYFGYKFLKVAGGNQSLATTVFRRYMDSKKVVVLLDGFDEIPISSQKKASKMIKSLADAGFHMYLTTRPSQKTHLEELLGTFAVTINPFTRNDQVMFLHNFFVKALNVGDGLESVGSFVEKLLDAAKLNLNDHDQEFTGIPLQTKLLAEVFTQQCESFIVSGHFLNKYFDLVYLYKHFIEQKVKIVCRKFGNASEDMIYRYKTYRSLYALRMLFTKEDLSELNVEERLNQAILLFPDTLQDIQKDGIVVAEHQSNVTFVHRTFAEYLAAEWLSKNMGGEYRAVVQTLVKKAFDPGFTTVRNMFDRILAKCCPLHLAVINRQVNAVKEIILSDPDSLLVLDKGKRSFLHLAAAWGVHHPSVVKSDGELRALYQAVCRDNMMDILKVIPNSKVKSSRDELLCYTQLDYAVASGCLNVADAICARLEDVKHCLSHTNADIRYLSYYFSKFPYGSLGSIFVKYSVVNEVKASIYDRQSVKGDEDDLHGAIVSGNVQSASLLMSMGEDINEADKTGFSPLHLAAMFGHAVIVQLLLSEEADVNVRDSTGKTPLHWAALKGDRNIALLLLSDATTVDADMTDHNGMTALHCAVIADIDNRNETISVLLRSGSCVTTKDNYGKTPLHYALHYNQIETLKLLLTFGANISNEEGKQSPAYQDANSKDMALPAVLSSRDADGGTVLHWAADKGLADIVELFLSYGADVKLEDSDGKTAVHWAAERGHVDVLGLLLSKEFDINAKDTFGRTPLATAAEYGNTETVKFLLSMGAEAHEKDSLGRTALVQAIQRDYDDIIIALLSHGANLQTKDHENMSPLHWAAWSGHEEVVHLFLSKEVSLEVKDGYGRTPLICAAQNGHKAAVNSLLVRGAKVKVKDNQSMSALHWASWNGHSEVVELLLSNGASMEAKDENKRTALICAAHNGHTVTVTLLLSKGADKEAATDQNVTALNWAAHNGHGDVVNVLLTKGARLDLKSNLGRTALINAASLGYTGIVAALLSKGADVEAKDNEGMNALHCASFNGHIPTVEVLLDKKANIEEKSQYYKNALIYAADSGHTAIVSLLLTKGAKVDEADNENMSALTWAAHNGHVETTNLLLAERVNLERRNRHGRTPLVCAAQNGHTVVVNLLFRKGADINAKDNEGMSAIHWAAYNGNLQMIKMLLAKRVDLEMKDTDGRTPLVHTTYYGHTNVASLLLSKGACVDVSDDEGMTALVWASWKGHTAMVELLLSKGANLEMQDYRGKTALMYAVCGGHVAMVELLLSKGANLEMQDNQGKTALMYSIWVGHTSILALLLSKGAKLDVQEKEEKTALHFAVSRGFTDAVYVLVSIGADLELRDEQGRTPLIYAATQGHVATVAFLVSRKASIDVRDKTGLTALDWAQRNGHESVVQFFSRHTVSEIPGSSKNS